MAVELDEGEDRPNQWNTLRALRVLDWYSGRELTQMPLEGTGNEPNWPLQ